MNNLQDLLGSFRNFLGLLPAVIIGLALLFFLWKLMRQMNVGGNVDAKKLRSAILMGILILFFMVSIWAIVEIIQQIFFPGGILVSPTI